MQVDRDFFNVRFDKTYIDLDLASFFFDCFCLLA